MIKKNGASRITYSKYWRVRLTIVKNMPDFTIKYDKTMFYGIPRIHMLADLNNDPEREE